MKFSATRAKKYASELIRKYKIDCSGLTILTEAASGPYLFNPMIPILAGADEVITYCRNSSYAKVDEVHKDMTLAYSQVKIDRGYTFISSLDKDDISRADIVTNSGHLRPINSSFIKAMKSKAVISLMWEPWELRPGEIAINVAKRKGILIMGVNEHEKPCDTRPFSFLTALHLLMSHQASIVDDRILVIGDQYTLAQTIESGLLGLNFQCRRISSSADHVVASEAAQWATYILVAEHVNKRTIIGTGGLIETDTLVNAGTLGVGVIAGMVERDELEAREVSVFPNKIAPPGYLSYMPSELGPYPVMDLFAAGIKVGQMMAEGRKSGLSTKMAAQYALTTSPAMDLEGKLKWIED